MKQEFGLEPAGPPPSAKTAGERYEGIAFTFCKVATVALIAQRFTLPVAAILSAVFYVLAYVKGKPDTRCWLRMPLLIAGFWACVAAISISLILYPDALQRLLV